MTVLFVVDRPEDWPYELEGARVVTSREYLTDVAYAEQRSVRVMNLCRSTRYQDCGYYVSLLAEARGQRALPGARVLCDVQAEELDTLLGAGADEALQRALAAQDGPALRVDACFGRDPTQCHQAVAQLLFTELCMPLVRADFERIDGRWRLRAVHALGIDDFDPRHRPAVAAAARRCVSGHRAGGRDRASDAPRIAILHDDDEPQPPSNDAALGKLCDAAHALGMRASILGRDDIDRLARFDALFVRDTTHVNHYTYAFARRASAEGLVVVDDPDSILKCTNKVYLQELFAHHGIPGPKTLVVHRDNVDRIVPMLGLPCIVKQPDSAFSLGVAKIETPEALRRILQRLFSTSELLIAQEWLPTPYDWRVGVFDRRPLYVCKYFMAPGHWQVVKREPGRTLEGSTQALSIGEAPDDVVRTALRAANLIGDGLYGVDVKRDGQRCYVMEVNDNPNLDAGNEDGVLKDALYREVMGVFCRRIRERSEALP